MPFIYCNLPCKNKLAKPAVTGQHKHPLTQRNYFSHWQGLPGKEKMRRKYKPGRISNAGNDMRKHIYLPNVEST